MRYLFRAYSQEERSVLKEKGRRPPLSRRQPYQLT